MAQGSGQTANWAGYAVGGGDCDAPRRGIFGRAIAMVDSRLASERDQLFAWAPVMLGTGIAAWFLLPGTLAWAGFILSALGAASLAALAIDAPFLRVAGAGGALLMAMGCGLIWWRAESVAAPVLERPVVVRFAARVERAERTDQPGEIRLTVRTRTGEGLPPRVRVTVPARANSIPGNESGLAWPRGTSLAIRARLMPPPRASLPGGYDFARRAWFDGIGAVGRVLDPPEIIAGDDADALRPGLRERLSAHVRSRLSERSGPIASALATGDRGGMAQTDAEALRRAGLAHLLSVSGLHITAVVGATMLLVMRLLALSPWLALRVRLPVVAAAAGAVAAFGYTWLTGGEVPTVRSLIAALLVLAALALGREAISLRMLAAGAFVVLLLWPESLVGPSFQLSFAAMLAIVTLHGNRPVAQWLARRDEGLAARLVRGLAGLFATGLAVELALMPIALFHFHKAGIYGALANIVAIPLTTFVVMPAEAVALLLDAAGWGAPAWWVVEQGISFLLWLAHSVANAPGATASLGAMPVAAFAAMAAGGLWFALWQQRWRLAGLVPFAWGMGVSVMTPTPDLLVTSDGRHVAVRLSGDRFVLMRERAGDYVRDQLAEAAGVDAIEGCLADAGTARCSRDYCLWTMRSGRYPRRGEEPATLRNWTILAARSRNLARWSDVVAACARADIVIADRSMPRACRPRWILADRRMLRRTGGLAIWLSEGRVQGAFAGDSGKPWGNPPTIMPPTPAPPGPTPLRNRVAAPQ